MGNIAKIVLALACSSLFAVSAVAQDAPPPAGDVPAVVPAPEPALRQLSVTVSPIHLALPVVELTGELALQPKLSVAVIAGYGNVDQSASTGGTVPVATLEAGAQVRYYLLGNFEHGLQIGAEALYIHVSTSTTSGNVSISASGQGLAVGPFIGYKVVSSMGFTFDAQLGTQRVGIGAEAKANTGETASASSSEWGPLLNLNVGWTF